jgi:hypothetical protein
MPIDYAVGAANCDVEEVLSNAPKDGALAESVYFEIGYTAFDVLIIQDPIGYNTEQPVAFMSLKFDEPLAVPIEDLPDITTISNPFGLDIDISEDYAYICKMHTKIYPVSTETIRMAIGCLCSTAGELEEVAL